MKSIIAIMACFILIGSGVGTSSYAAEIAKAKSECVVHADQVNHDVTVVEAPVMPYETYVLEAYDHFSSSVALHEPIRPESGGIKAVCPEPIKRRYDYIYLKRFDYSVQHRI